MNAWLVQIKREFWENQTQFVIIPLVIAVIILLACIYAVTLQASKDSGAGRALFGHVYFFDTGDGTGPANAEDKIPEYTIDFTSGKLVRAENSGLELSPGAQRRLRINAALYGIHTFIMMITGVVLMFYQLNCLNADRKDRSILFWKSMPLSEERNIAVKYIVSMLAVPLVVTLISWGIQVSYLLLSSVFVYRVGSSPWQLVWGNLNLLHVFFQELILFLWNMAWWAPLAAWLLFSSALGKRSPFLVAAVPVIVVIIMDNLLSGSWHVGNILLTHWKEALLQPSNLIGEESVTGLMMGKVNIFLDAPVMITGIIAAVILFPATVWLRNHRFEI